MDKEKIRDIIQKETDMPPAAISDMAYVEISGRNYVEIEGIEKIIECSDEIVKIRFKHCSVEITGSKLHFENFNEKSAILKGTINSIEYN